MELVHGNITTSGPIALLPGAFHPPTIAHTGLARAALARVDSVLFTLPRAFPHKGFETTSLAQRIELLQLLAAAEPRFAVAISSGGLFLDMAREARLLFPRVQSIHILCGRDAAERIVHWPYPANQSIETQFAHYSLLVASREGPYLPPPHLAFAIEPLPLPANWDAVSSTRVRQAIARGKPWRHLVPAAIADRVAGLYSPSRLDSKNVRSR